MTYNRSQYPDKASRLRVIHEAVDRGVTLFDTAIIYGPLNNEEFIGEALAPYKGKVNITSKFGHEVVNGKGTGRQDSSRATVRKYCEKSNVSIDCGSVCNYDECQDIGGILQLYEQY